MNCKVVSAQNQDILWQKTLTKDTIPIASIAIAEGKYVAVLKGDEIVILDYKTGDSIRAFAKPGDMVGNDIVLGKGGERVYVHVYGYYLRSWDIVTGENFRIIALYPAAKDFYHGLLFKGHILAHSLNGKFITCSTSYNWDNGPDNGSSATTMTFNTEDSIYIQQKGPFPINNKSGGEILDKIGFTGGIYSLYFSPSGNYLLRNVRGEWHSVYHGEEYHEYTEGSFTSFSPKLKSYTFSSFLPEYLFSFEDDFLLNGNNIMDIPPTHIIRSIAKKGFIFLPDDNHMLAFHTEGGVAAISNIQKDIWEKVFYGDSLTENIIRPNASLSAFATATNSRITLWKIPDTLQKVALTADFTMSKDSIAIFDSIVFTNLSFPLKRESFIEWNFGDGSSKSSEHYPTHRFIKSGIITVTLSIGDKLGGKSTISKNIIVSFPSPKAVFTTPKDTVFVGDMVSFTNTSTPIRNGTYFNWNFGDGASSTEFNPKHQFFQTGTFTIKLSIHDTLVRKDNTTKTIVVIEQIVPNGASWVNHFHYKQINSIAFSHDAQSIISGSDDGFSRVWTTYSATQLYLKNFGQPVYSVTFTKDNKTCIVGSYRITDNSPIYKKGSIAKLISNTDIWSFSGDSLESKIYWDVQSANSSLSYQYLTKSSLCSSVSDDNNWYLLGTRFYSVFSPFSFDSNPKVDSFYYGNIYLYNVSTGQSKYFDPYHPYLAPKGDLTYLLYPVYSVLVSPDSRFYLYSQGSRVFIRDIITDSVCFITPKFSPTMHFSPDKYHLLTNTGLLDIYQNLLIKNVDLPSIFEYHPDGIHVFTLRTDSTIGIYNLNTNSYEYIYPKQSTTFTALAVAPDGKHIATGDKYGYITVWNVPDSLKSSIKADFNTTLLKRSNLKTTDTIPFANTTLPANNTFDFLWNFGDGNTSTEKNPKYVYSKSGTYTVTLSALNNGKVIDSMTKLKYITIEGVLDTEETKIGLDVSFNVIPNPSYGETNISYTLSQPSPIQIRISDVLGREVSSWSLNEQAGEHSILWNSEVGAGMYYCTFNTSGIIRTLPFVILR